MLSARALTRSVSHGIQGPSCRSSGSLTAAKALWNGRLVISEEVEHALHRGYPVVALESAIITHGMPYPANLSTAVSLETIIRSHSCTPATIALLSGKVHIGLSKPQLEYLSDTSGKKAVKVSRRDLGAAIAQRRDGGTTVAGTMVLAHSVGIKTFVTGGIGGVHRGAESSMDVSADLIELGRTPMAVICAGAKSILDIPRTLEVLETQGVCVATYGNTSDFPAFYTPSSGQSTSWAVSSIQQAASLIHTSLSLPSPLSTLLAVPIPSEYAARGDKVQTAVEQAVRESVEQGIDKRGKEVTPWLLKRVGELTHGSALELNIKLIENNAQIGSQVAKEVSRLFNVSRDASHTSYFPGSTLINSSRSQAPSISNETSPSPTSSRPAPSVLVFGSAAIDLTSTPKGDLLPRTTTPGEIFVSPGGVGRNIAEAAQNLLPPHAVKLISMVGTSSGEVDAFGKLLMSEMERSGLRTDGLVPLEGLSTAVCNLILEEGGDLVNGVADMGIIETLDASGSMIRDIIRTSGAKMVAFDCNLTEAAIMSILSACQDAPGGPIPTFCDPTSFTKLRKLSRVFQRLEGTPLKKPYLTHLSPNVLELDILNELIQGLEADGGIPAHSAHDGVEDGEHTNWVSEESLNGSNLDFVVERTFRILEYVDQLWVKGGSNGLLRARRTSNSKPTSETAHLSTTAQVSEGERGYAEYTHYPPPRIELCEIISTTGAGDTLVGGLIAGLVEGGFEEEVWVEKALEGVGKSLRSRRAVG